MLKNNLDYFYYVIIMESFFTVVCMDKYLKYVIFFIVCVIIIFLGVNVYLHFATQIAYQKVNICQDDDLIAKLISQNINPFSKFNFIKKWNEDCNSMLIENKNNSINSQTYSQEVCSILKSSTNSVSMLVLTYVNEMYDRETASKELRKTARLMTPYNSCPEYMDEMIDLIRLKKRLGL